MIARLVLTICLCLLPSVTFAQGQDHWTALIATVIASEELACPAEEIIAPVEKLQAIQTEPVQKPLLINEIGKPEHQPKAEPKTVKPKTRTHTPSKRLFNRFRRW